MPEHGRRHRGLEFAHRSALFLVIKMRPLAGTAPLYLAGAAAVASVIKIAPSQILLGLAIASLLIARDKWRWPPLTWPVALWMAWTLVSLAASGHAQRRAAAGEEVLRLVDAVRGVFRSPHSAPDSSRDAGMDGRGDAFRTVGFRTVRAHVPLHAPILLLRLRQRQSHHRLRRSLDDVQRAAHDDAADGGRDAAVLHRPAAVRLAYPGSLRRLQSSVRESCSPSPGACGWEPSPAHCGCCGGKTNGWSRPCRS